MPYETITLEGFVNEFSSAAKGSNPRRFCFILGAGASISSGIKTGQQLVDIWEKELSKRNPNEHKKWKSDLGINDTNMATFYSKYYDRRFKRNRRDGYNYLENEMEGKKPSIGYVALAHLLATTPNNVVITTNFDHLTEDAISYHQQIMPRVIGHEALAHYGIEETSRPLIIKIHRDLLLTPKSEESAVEELDKKWEPCLSSIFSRYCPIFIGYAGNDKSLMNFLIGNAEKFKNEWQCPYWLAYNTEPTEPSVVEFLDKSDSYLILNNGFDDVMIDLGRARDFQFPIEDAFINDGKKRYSALKEAFDSYAKRKNQKNSKLELDDNSRCESSADSLAFKSANKEVSLYPDAITKHNKGEYYNALELEDCLIKLDPNNARYHNARGVTLLEMGYSYEALKANRKAVQLDPDNAFYHYCLTRALHELKRYDEALSSIKKAVNLDPTNGFYQNSLGIAYEMLGDYDNAIIAKQKAVFLAPNRAEYKLGLDKTMDAAQKKKRND